MEKSTTVITMALSEYEAIVSERDRLKREVECLRFNIVEMIKRDGDLMRVIANDPALNRGRS